MIQQYNTPHSYFDLIGTLAVHLLALLMILAVFCFGVPQYAESVAEADFDVAVMTVHVIRASEFIGQYWFVIALLVVNIDGAVTIKLFLLHRVRMFYWWTVLVLFAITALFAYSTVALCLLSRDPMAG